MTPPKPNENKNKWRLFHCPISITSVMMIVNFAWISIQWNGEMIWIINIFIFFNFNLLISHRWLASVYLSGWDCLSRICIRWKPVSNLIHFMWISHIKCLLNASRVALFEHFFSPWNYFWDSAACTRTPWHFDRIWHWDGIKSYGFCRIDSQFKPNRNLKTAQRVMSK